MRHILRVAAVEIFRPVFVNLLTAAFLFTFAVVLKSEILKLFGLDDARGYSITCAAEMYQSPNGADEVWLDFFLVNSSGTLFEKRSELIKHLKEESPDPDLDLSPDIHLALNDSRFRFRTTVEMDQASAAFNHGKGELKTSIQNNAQSMTIHLNEISPYNLLKTTVVIDGYRFPLGDKRGLATMIPIHKRKKVFEYCYTIE